MARVVIVVEEMGYAYRQEIGYYLLLEKGVATRNYTLKATPAGGVPMQRSGLGYSPSRRHCVWSRIQRFDTFCIG